MRLEDRSLTDLGIMDVWLVHVFARDQPVMVEAQGLFWKSPKSVKDRPSSVPLLCHIVLPHVLYGQDLAD